MNLLNVPNFLIILSILIQPLGLVSLARAEEVNMEYTDPDHLHAPKVVNEVEYQYDANGNLTFDGERVISWNQDNLPTRVEKDGKIVEFFYDANGRRVVKRSGQQTLTYVNERYQSSVDADGNPTTTKHYFANGRTAQSVDDTLTFLHQDHLGSTVLATDSSSRVLGNTLSYFPYGDTINSQLPTLNYLFTGQEKDPESNLYNYKARLYNPTTGSFISADLLVGDPEEAIALNRYAYAHRNPLRFVDPLGRQYVDVSDWGTTGVGGFPILYSPTTSEQQREHLKGTITGALSYFDPEMEVSAVPILLMDEVLIGQAKRSYPIAAGWLETSEGAGFQIRIGEGFFEMGRQEHWILHEFGHIFDWKNKRVSLGDEFKKAISTSDFYNVLGRLDYGYVSKYEEMGEQWRLSETFAEALAFYWEGSEVMKYVPDLVEYFDQLLGRTEEAPSPVINYPGSEGLRAR